MNLAAAPTRRTSPHRSELTLTAPTLVDVSVDHVKNSPGTEADTEVILDIDVAGELRRTLVSLFISRRTPSRAGSTP